MPTFTPKLSIIEVDKFAPLWNDKGSGGENNGSYFHPIPPDGYKCLGSYGQGNHHWPAPSGNVIAIKALEEGALCDPCGYEAVWTELGTGANLPCSFWTPIPPPGYCALGTVVMPGHDAPPLSAVTCVRKDLLVDGRVGDMIWNDQGTGAPGHFGCWQIVSDDPRAIQCNTFVALSTRTTPTVSLMHALNSELTCFARPLPASMDQLRSLKFKTGFKQITFAKNRAPLDFHSIAGFRWQHLQDMIRLPDANGKHYYMGTYSQNCSTDEGGLVFVAELSSGATQGNVIWFEELNNRHVSGGFNHPGDLRRIGNIVVIAGQNWDGGPSRFTPGADPMSKGHGGQAILFYDVSNTQNPVYRGKLNRFWKLGKQEKTPEIDQVTVAKSGDYFYLAFNGAKCRAKHLSPSVRWDLIQEGGDGSPSPVSYSFQGTSYIGGAKRRKGSHEINFDALEFFAGQNASPTELNETTSFVKRTPVVTVCIPNDPLDSECATSLSVMPDGSGAFVIANVNSHHAIEILELETE